MKFSSFPMVQTVIQWEKHEKMNNLYVERMQSVLCSLYSQERVQLPKKEVRQPQAYTNDFQTLQFELYWAGIEGIRVFGDILLICMCLMCVKKCFPARQALSWILHLPKRQASTFCTSKHTLICGHRHYDSVGFWRIPAISGVLKNSLGMFSIHMSSWSLIGVHFRSLTISFDTSIPFQKRETGWSALGSAKLDRMARDELNALLEHHGGHLKPEFAQSGRLELEPKNLSTSPPKKLFRQSYLLFLVSLYICCLYIFAWVILCVQVQKPITTRTYGYRPDYTNFKGALSNRMHSNSHWFRAVKVILAVTNALIIPLTSTVCAGAAVIYVQTVGLCNNFNMRQTITLADKGWTSLPVWLELWLLKDGDPEVPLS